MSEDKQIFKGIKTFSYPQLSGKTLEILTTIDIADGTKTTVTMGRDIKTGEMYVFDSTTEVNE